jgi:hypothetical protein
MIDNPMPRGISVADVDAAVKAVNTAAFLLGSRIKLSDDYLLLRDRARDLHSAAGNLLFIAGGMAGIMVNR